MNNEQILSKLFKIKETLRKLESSTTEVDALIEAVTEDINIKAAKAQGKKGPATAAIRLLKWAGACSSDYTKAFVTSEGKQMLVNGAWGIILHGSLPIPTHTDTQKLKEIDHTRKAYEDIIGTGRDNQGEKISAPDRTELKTHISVSKAKRRANKTHERITYQITDRCLLDAEYLLAIIELIPDAVFRTREPNQDARWNLQPVYFSGENGEGVLVPLRPAV